MIDEIGIACFDDNFGFNGSDTLFLSILNRLLEKKGKKRKDRINETESNQDNSVCRCRRNIATQNTES